MFSSTFPLLKGLLDSYVLMNMKVERKVGRIGRKKREREGNNKKECLTSLSKPFFLLIYMNELLLSLLSACKESTWQKLIVVGGGERTSSSFFRNRILLHQTRFPFATSLHKQRFWPWKFSFLILFFSLIQFTATCMQLLSSIIIYDLTFS